MTHPISKSCAIYITKCCIIFNPEPEELNGVARVRELLGRSIDRVKAGAYEDAKELLREAEETTKCGSCRKMIQRTRTDLDYVKNLCTTEEEDCIVGAENVTKKIKYIKDDYLSGDDNE